VVAAGPRLAAVWQAQYTEPPGGAAARVAAAGPGKGTWAEAYRRVPPGTSRRHALGMLFSLGIVTKKDEGVGGDNMQQLDPSVGKWLCI